MSEPNENKDEVPQRDALEKNEAAERQRSRWYVLAWVIAAIFSFAVLVYMTRFENDSRKDQELDALFTLLSFFIFGLAIVAIIPEIYPELRGSKAVIGFLLVVPLLAFLVLTDRISSISGAGVSLTVVNVGETSLPVGRNPINFSTPGASEPVCFDDQPEPYTVPIQVQVRPDAAAPIWTEIAPESQQQVTQVPNETPTPAPAARGPTNYWKLTLLICSYNATELKTQLEEVIAAGAFRFILLVDDANRFVAYIPAGDAVRLFDAQADALVTAINERPADLRNYTGIVFEPLTSEDTTLEALARMQEQNLDMVPIVGEDGVVRGVAALSQVLTSMMLELATNTAN